MKHSLTSLHMVAFLILALLSVPARGQDQTIIVASTTSQTRVCFATCYRLFSRGPASRSRWLRKARGRHLTQDVAATPTWSLFMPEEPKKSS